MKKTRARIHEDMLIHREKIKTESNSLKVDCTAEDLSASITCIESNRLEQETREGYNQVDETQITAYQNIDTIADGIITSSSLTNSNLVNFTVNTNNIEIENGDYYISCDIRLKSGTCERLNTLQALRSLNTSELIGVGVVSDTNITNQFKRFTRKYVFGNSNEDKINRFLIQATNCENAVFEVKNIQISREDKEYEKYGQCPSTQFKSEVEGITGDVNLLVRNHNYFNLKEIIENKFVRGEDTEQQGLLANSNASNTSNFIFIKKNQSVVISYNYDTLESSNQRGYAFYDKNKNVIRKNRHLLYNPTNKKIIISAEEDFYFRFSYDKNCYDIQVEYGIESTDYIEGKKQNFTISLGNKTLYKGDKIVRQNGKWYFLNNFGILDNSKHIFASDKVEQGYYITSSVISNFKDGGLIYSTNQKAKYDIKAYEKDIDWMKKDGNIISQLYKNVKQIYINYFGDNVNEWWISLNAKICYELETPTYTEITDPTLFKQLDKILLNLYEYDDETNFDFDNDVTFEIEVEKDKLRILENRLDKAEQNTTNAEMLALESEV